MDDDPRVRELLSLELEDLGVIANCFPSAVDLLGWDHLHDLNLILLDLVMPGMDGMTCLEKLRQGQFTGMVVVVTANWDATREKDLLRAGADGCWNKTVALDRLAPLLESLRRDQLP